MRSFALVALSALLPFAAAAQAPVKQQPIEVRAMTTLATICTDYVAGKPTEGLIRRAVAAGYYEDPMVKGDDQKGHVYIWTVDREMWPVNTIQLSFGPDMTRGNRFCEVKVNNGDVEIQRLLGMVKRYATTMANPPFVLTLERYPNGDKEGERWSSVYSRPGQQLVVSDRPQPKDRYDPFWFKDVVTIALVNEK